MCEKCKKSFTRKSSLKKHLALHDLKKEGLKPGIVLDDKSISGNGKQEPTTKIQRNSSDASKSSRLNQEISKQVVKNVPDVETSLKLGKRNILRKPRKGTWIVKLERIDLPWL